MLEVPGFDFCKVLEHWNEYWETKVWSTQFGVTRVARCRITSLNLKNIISFWLILILLKYVKLYYGKPKQVERYCVLSYGT